MKQCFHPLGFSLLVWGAFGLAASGQTQYSFTMLAGLAGSPGSPDGAGSRTRFFHPSGGAVDSGGSVFRADDGNDDGNRSTERSGVAFAVSTRSGAGDWGGHPKLGRSRGCTIAGQSDTVCITQVLPLEEVSPFSENTRIGSARPQGDREVIFPVALRREQRLKRVKANTELKNLEVRTFPGGSHLNPSAGGCQDFPAAFSNGMRFPFDKSLKIYRCPTDPSFVQLEGKKHLTVRSYSIQGQMNSNAGLNNPQYYSINRKYSDINGPPPEKCMVSVDEESVDDGYFWVQIEDKDIWHNIPAPRHSNGSNFSFADGHAEHWRWLEPNTLTLKGWDQPAVKPFDRDLQREKMPTLPGDESGALIVGSNPTS